MAEEFSLDDDTEIESDSIIGDMPEVSEHAIVAAQQSTPENNDNDGAVTGDKDKAGEVWNADVHTANKQQTAKGLWRRKRGKAGGVKSSSVALPDQREKQQAEARETAKNNARMAGAAAANSIFLLGTMLGGEEWRPITIDKEGLTFQDIDEKKVMSEAFSDYMLAKGVTDFPPGVTLAMALMSYVAPRLTMPKTKQRLKGVRGWIALRLAKRRIKKAFKKNNIDADVTIDGGNILINGRVYDGTRFDFRDNTQRENVQSKEASASVQAK